jgi:hypothetical protein
MRRRFLRKTEIKMVFDGDLAPIAVPARGSGEAVRSFLQQCKYDLKQSPSSPAEGSTLQGCMSVHISPCFLSTP